MARTAGVRRTAAAHLVPLAAPDPTELPPHQVVHSDGSDASTVDEWGRDERFVRAVSPLASIRWDVSVGGKENVRHGGGLIVINTRRFALSPIFTALFVGEALDRPVRFVGRPDFVPFGPVLRRIGGVLAAPEEIAGALRAGELVVLGAEGTSNVRQAGPVDPALIAPAIHEHVAVYIAATLSSKLNRHARVEIGPALRINSARRGPLAEVELAELAQHRLQIALDELGPMRRSLSLPGWGLLGANRDHS
jgi:hypothetical protein